jgi:hypothetical protein
VQVGKRIFVSKVDAARRGSHTLKLPRGTKSVRVRVRDAAGNFSKWKNVRIR